MVQKQLKNKYVHKNATNIEIQTKSKLNSINTKYIYQAIKKTIN